MNPRLLNPTNRPALPRRATRRGRGPAALPAAELNAPRRRQVGAWLAALRPAPLLARLFRAPPRPADPPPAGPPAAPIDARELSPWAPFSPRF